MSRRADAAAYVHFTTFLVDSPSSSRRSPSSPGSAPSRSCSALSSSSSTAASSSSPVLPRPLRQPPDVVDRPLRRHLRRHPLGESNAGSLVWPRAAVELPFELAEMLDPPPKPAADAAAMPERGRGHHSEWWDSGRRLRCPPERPPVGVPPAVPPPALPPPPPALRRGSSARGAWRRLSSGNVERGARLPPAAPTPAPHALYHRRALPSSDFAPDLTANSRRSLSCPWEAPGGR